MLTKCQDDAMNERPSLGRVPVRCLIVLLIFMSTAVDYLTRVNINVAMVSMVAPLSSQFDHDEQFTGVCPTREPPTNSSRPSSTSGANGRFEWDARLQGIILGSFYYSYVFMQIPMGRLAEQFGGKWIVSISLLGSALVNLMTPLIASSATALIVSRIVLGLFQGGVFPAAFAILRQWFPEKERSFAFSFLEFGGTIGLVVGSAASGYLSDHGFAGGWPSTFYVSGAIGLVAFCLWTLIGQSFPEESPFISNLELLYIRGHEDISETNSSKPSVPWKSIFTSVPFLALMLSKFCLNFSASLLMSKLPAFLNDVLRVSSTTNGIANALMWSTTAVTVMSSGYFSETVIQRGLLSRTNVRKVFFAVATFGSALCLVLLPSVGCRMELAVGLLVMVNFFFGFNAGGDVPLPSEMSAHFPATLFAIMNTLNSSCGMLAPYLVGIVLESHLSDSLFDLWAIMFYMSALVTAIGGLVFVSLVDARRQPWDFVEEDDKVSVEDESSLSSYGHGTESSGLSDSDKSIYHSCN